MPCSEHRTMVVPIIRKHMLSVDEFRAYWREVHGPLAARLDGIGHYEQLHLDGSIETFGENESPYAREAFDGLAVLSFDDEAALARYRALGPVMPGDEVNAFGFAARYDIDGQAEQRIAPLRQIPSNLAARHGCVVFIHRRKAADQDRFVRFVADISLNAEAKGMGVWLDFTQPRSEDRPQPEAVDRFTPYERQFQAVLRLGGCKQQDIREIAAGLAGDISVSCVKVAPIAASHVFVYQQALTLSAVRGPDAAALIRKAQAANQMQPLISALFLPGNRQLDVKLL